MPIGGVFQMMNSTTGLKEPRMTATTVKLINTASNDWRNRRSSPSSGASMPLINALASVVSNTISGNLMAL